MARGPIAWTSACLIGCTPSYTRYQPTSLKSQYPPDYQYPWWQCDAGRSLPTSSSSGDLTFFTPRSTCTPLFGGGLYHVGNSVHQSRGGDPVMMPRNCQSRHPVQIPHFNLSSLPLGVHLSPFNYLRWINSIGTAPFQPPWS